MVNVYRSLRFGVLWGLLALVLALLVIFLTPIFQPFMQALAQVGIDLAWFAIMMAGVHFGARSGYRGWLASIFGGGIAGFIAAIFLVLANYLFGEVAFSVGSSLITLAVAFVVGMFGGFAGEFIDRQG